MSAPALSVFRLHVHPAVVVLVWLAWAIWTSWVILTEEPGPDWRWLPILPGIVVLVCWDYRPGSRSLDG